MSQERIPKVNSLIYEELSQLLSRENSGDFMVTITRVEVCKSLEKAKVFFTVLPQKKRGRAMELLKRMRREWQHELGGRLDLKYTPRLEFLFDKGHENAMLVEELLSKNK